MRSALLRPVVLASLLAGACDLGPKEPRRDQVCTLEHLEHEDAAPAEQALMVIAPELELRVPSDTGVFRCRPGRGEGCTELLAEGCVIEVRAALGERGEVAVGLHNPSPVALSLLAISLAADTDPALSLGEPLPLEVPHESTVELLVRFEPEVDTDVAGSLVLVSDAGNTPQDDLVVRIEGRVVDGP